MKIHVCCSVWIEWWKRALSWKNKEKKVCECVYNIDGLTTHFSRLDWQTIINVCRCVKKKWRGARKRQKNGNVQTKWEIWCVMKSRHIATSHTHTHVPVQWRKATPSTHKIFYWLFNEHLMVLLIFNMFHFIWWDGCVYVHCVRLVFAFFWDRYRGTFHQRKIRKRKKNRENNMKLMRGRWILVQQRRVKLFHYQFSRTHCTYMYNALTSYAFVGWYLMNASISARRLSAINVTTKFHMFSLSLTLFLYRRTEECKLKMTANTHREKLNNLSQYNDWRRGKSRYGTVILVVCILSVHMNFIWPVENAHTPLLKLKQQNLPNVSYIALHTKKLEMARLTRMVNEICCYVTHVGEGECVNVKTKNKDRSEKWEKK